MTDESASTLDPAAIAESAKTLAARVHERFPGRTLDSHALAFSNFAAKLASASSRTFAPRSWFTVIAWSGGVSAVALLIYAGFAYIRTTVGLQDAGTFLQALDSAFTILAGLVAGYFTMRLIAAHASRQRALKGLGALREFIHVTDMLQASKDPARLLFPIAHTESSRREIDDPAAMARYLSYCCLMYTLASKFAVLHARWVQDAAVLSTIDDIEDLCTDLEAKSARKLLLLERVPAGAGRPSTH